MRYIKLGATGLDVSPVAIGAMTYGDPGRGRALRDFANRDGVVIATKLRHPMRPGPNGRDCPARRS